MRQEIVQQQKIGRTKLITSAPLQMLKYFITAIILVAHIQRIIFLLKSTFCPKVDYTSNN